jgi:hypothetical protein
MDELDNPVRKARIEFLGVECLQGFGAELRQPDFADFRLDVQTDEEMLGFQGFQAQSALCHIPHVSVEKLAHLNLIVFDDCSVSRGISLGQHPFLDHFLALKPLAFPLFVRQGNFSHP